jgi:PAS domain-containing protein
MDAGVATHGICERCALLFESFDQQHLSRFLDGLEQPVLCVDDDGRVLHGNQRAAVELGKDLEQLRGHLGGEVIECVHSREPGGCGKTASCAACVVRGSVRQTFETGRPVHDAKAWQEVFADGGVRRQLLRVSTEKRGDFVLLAFHADVNCAV